MSVTNLAASQGGASAPLPCSPGTGVSSGGNEDRAKMCEIEKGRSMDGHYCSLLPLECSTDPTMTNKGV